MSKTLVVGGNGYIGRHLKKIFPEFIYVGREEFDLNDSSKLKKFLSKLDIDRCIILSAVIKYEKIVNFTTEPLKTNLVGLNNLLSLLDDKVKVIYFSSMTVYDKGAISPVKEDSNLLPLHTYGLSKVYAEQLVKFYNFKSIIIRIPGIYGGDRKSGLIYNIIKNMKKNLDVEINTTNIEYWETMHIDDMLDMFSKLLKKYKYKTKSEIYNISYGEPTDILETVYFIKKILNSKSNVNINKHYKDFYLSNKKIVSFIGPPLMNFKERLEVYVEEIDKKKEYI